jgi:hypothetical protein
MTITNTMSMARARTDQRMMIRGPLNKWFLYFHRSSWFIGKSSAFSCFRGRTVPRVEQMLRDRLSSPHSDATEAHSWKLHIRFAAHFDLDSEEPVPVAVDGSDGA